MEDWQKKLEAMKFALPTEVPKSVSEPIKPEAKDAVVEKNPSWSQKEFPDERSAVKFIKDFWMLVDPHYGKQIADKVAGQLREVTMNYRTVLYESEVTVYRNNKGPFSDEVVAYLKSNGFSF